MPFNLDACRRECGVAFRVEAHDDHHLRQNCTFDDDGNMKPRDPWCKNIAQAYKNHLSWKRVGTPFISFFTNWNAALRRRQWMLEQGARKVLIVAVWLGGL